MCGIAGIYSFSENPVKISDLKRMTDTISHRGPDGEGHWVNRNSSIGFGHRRLSIIDLSENGKQPMHYLGRYTITFNGEIYNYIEIRKRLLEKGYQFKSDTDTEVLLALYDDKKKDCLQELDGMFSFAIWDEEEKVFFCARDRFGEKPFHYCVIGNQFIFASEIKQFWAIGIEKKLRSYKVKNFIYNGSTGDQDDATETFYEGIKKLDAAHYICLSQGKTDVDQLRYWDIAIQPNYKGSLMEASEQFRELLMRSVQLRLRSDVAVGTSLSGGLDSSSIVMLIDALKSQTMAQNSFSARFRNFDKDEGKYIEEVVKACKNLNIHYTWPDKNYFESVFEKVCFYQDEPFGSASIVAQYAVMELAKKNNVTVLLDGQGADEYLAGYSPYYRMHLSALFYNDRKSYKAELSAYNALHPVSTIESFERIESIQMKLGRYKAKLLNLPPAVAKNALATQLKNDTLSDGLKTLLRYADRNSMAHSREVRLPFLSHKLVEFVFSLPDHFKLGNGWTKLVLRESMKGILPTAITWRTDKIGYEPPQNQWIAAKKTITNIKRIIDKYDLNEKLIVDSGLTNDKNWKFMLIEQYEK